MRKGLVISLILLIIGLSWMAYNYFVVNPAYNKKISCLDEKDAILSQADTAYSQNDKALGDQYMAQEKAIVC